MAKTDLDIELLRRALSGGLVGSRLIYYDSLTSTMDEARRLAERGEPEGTVVIAEEQTAGRGRFGRVLRLARKPTYDEFVKSSWIVGIGIGIVGLIGFIIYYIWLKVPPIISDVLGI